MRIVLAAALAAPLVALGGCGKEKLTEVQVPDSGIAMTYDLTAGQSYGGHIKMRNSVQTPMGDMIQSIEFDVDLVVQGDVGGTSLVSATVSEIDLSVRLPACDGGRLQRRERQDPQRHEPPLQARPRR